MSRHSETCPVCRKGPPPHRDAETIIDVRGLGYRYRMPPVDALRDVEFTLPRGAFCAVIGPNGSGKTTLIKLMMGLLDPTSGRIRVQDHDPAQDAAAVQRLVGYVPQQSSINLSPPLTAREVVSLAAYTRNAGGKRSVKDRVDRALDMVGILSMAGRPFRSLSGGQRQRTLIARALAVDPPVLVLDEPFGQVDAASQTAIGDLLHHLATAHGVTVVVVVHDVNPICHFITHTLLLRTRQVAFGTPADVLTVENLREAYGTLVPVLVCDEGYRHPVIQASHD